MPDISQSKGNQTMKLGQLIEHNKKHIRLVPDLFLFFKKA